MVNILGIKLSSVNREAALEQLRSWLESDTGHLVVTPNPEIILTAQADEELFYILNQADLALADGFGLKLAAWLSGQSLVRFTGADLVNDLLRLAESQDKPVGVLNWRGGLSKQPAISAALTKSYPRLRHLVVDTSRTQITAANLAQIEAFKPAIIFCTFGSPYQEKALYHKLAMWPSVRLAVGCGGAFDFISGQLVRAPRSWQRLGLEWLWRLLKQPSRYRRIYNAVFVFSWRVFKRHFIHPFCYRPNVACLMYRQTERGRDILIVEREDEAGHWQLPQGGLDGEDVSTAGSRELREETGTDRFIVRGVYPGLYRYKFGSASWKKSGYRGQKQSLIITEFTGRDEDIKINFWDHRSWKWVPQASLLAELQPTRRAAAQIYLQKLDSLE